MTIVSITEPQEKSQICDQVLRSLPDWFGIESAIQDYVLHVQEMETWVAMGPNPVGFLSLKKHYEKSAEIFVMGILPEHQGQGIGRSLIQSAEKSLLTQGFTFLTVKTLSESQPDEYYDKTRKFYLRSGFNPVEEFKTLWGEANPCLMLIKNLTEECVTYPSPNRSSLLSHVEISVSNYARTIRFYDRVLYPLGWKRLVCQTHHATYTDGALKLVFCPVDDRFREFGFHRKRVGLNHIAFYAKSKESVDEVFKVVSEAKDITCLYEGRPTGEDDYYVFYFEDPDRIKIEVVYSPDYCAPNHWTNRIGDDFDPYS